MPNNTTPYENDPASGTPHFGDELSDMTAQVKEKVSDFGTETASKFDAKREAAAHKMKEAASSMHQNAGAVFGGDKLTSMAHSAASALDCTADWLRENDSKKLVADVTSLVKRNPGASMLAAIAFGFLVGRAFSRNHDNA
jgi:ElaB/YqjD/DUF883 family membrane-anchored ribosome-binding protein